MSAATAPAASAARAPARETLFVPAGDGQRLYVYHPSRAARPLGRVLHVPAFGEEMNKSRRMVALQAERLAEAGFAVLQPDLLGCGDSSGDFGDASWEAWIEDLLAAERWLAERAPGPLWLWGLRAGCPLAVAAAARFKEPSNFLFWQAPASGKLLMQQFLRLKVVGELLDGAAKGSMEAMRQQLAAGQSVEVAGYHLAPALVQGMEAATMAPPANGSARLVWLELSTREDAALMPVSAKTLDQWRTAGYQTQAQLVQGPSFWQTTEIEDAPALLDATVTALKDGAP